MSDKIRPGDPSPTLLRLALGVVFFHFGFLKFFPDLSPAEMLGSQTIIRLTGNAVDAHSAMFCLAVLECTIGLGFLFNVCLRFVSLLFFFHMIGTFTPLFVLPELAFKIGPLAPTFEGQYILKNVVFVAAGWTVLLPYCLPARRSVEGKSVSSQPANHATLVPTSTATSPSSHANV
ncbi:MAG: DoxX family membrane protein [Planctomycetaceae bacterium]|nr:DoxX family membrane protein [Planctomycetaceae bacterium]